VYSGYGSLLNIRAVGNVIFIRPDRMQFCHWHGLYIATSTNIELLYINLSKHLYIPSDGLNWRNRIFPKHFFIKRSRGSLTSFRCDWKHFGSASVSHYIAFLSQWLVYLLIRFLLNRLINHGMLMGRICAPNSIHDYDNWGTVVTSGTLLQFNLINCPRKWTDYFI